MAGRPAAVSGSKIRKTSCIALEFLLKARYHITVTGEMAESMAAQRMEFNSLRGWMGWLASRSLPYRLRRNAGVNRPGLKIVRGY
jgi:hypothetical protein